MNMEDKQKLDNYEKNRYVVTVKKDMFGNWYFVDGNGNRAQTVGKTGELIDAKHSKSEQSPIMNVKPISIEETRRGSVITRTHYSGHISNFPNMSTKNIMPFTGDNCTADTYEVFYQRQKMMEDVEEMFQKGLLLANGRKSTDGLTFFKECLEKMKAHFALYFSQKEHKYLRAFLKQKTMQFIPDEIKEKGGNTDKMIDAYLDEVSQLREQMMNSTNENLKYIASQADILSNTKTKEGSLASTYTFGFDVVDDVDALGKDHSNEL